MGEKPETSQEPEPIHLSTPLTKGNIKQIYDKEKTVYLKIAMKLNTTDLESSSEVADSENEKLYQEIINPTTALSLDDEISIDTQFRRDSDLSYTLPDPLKTKLDDILDNARDKINSVSFPPKPIEEIPNDLLYPHSRINTEDIYIDDSLQDLLYPGGIYFPQPSTDNRKDFEINIPENEMIVFKSPSLTFASVEKKELRNILNRIIEDLDFNLTEILMSKSDKTETKQNITLLKNLNRGLKAIKKEDIEKQIQSHEWLTQLVEDQLKENKTYYSLGVDYKNRKQKNKFKNVTTRKRKLLPLTSEDRLKELPSIYSLVSADKTKKTESAKNIFSNIIKNIPPESYKKFKIDYDQSNDINISEANMNQMTVNSQNELNTRVNNLFNNLQKNPKSVLYLVGNLSKTVLNKAKKSVFDKDKVFVNL